MNTQIYLLLKKTGDFNPATLNLKDVKNLILGDALDMPFVKWIRVTGLANSIGFSSGTIRSINATGDMVEKSYGSSAGSYSDALNASYVDQTANEVEDDFIRHHGVRRGQATSKFNSYAGKNRFGAQGRLQPKVQGQQFSQESVWRDDDWVDSPVQAPAGGANFTGGVAGNTSFTRFQNSKLKISLPDHDSLTFTKNCDNATPQLAFAASAQEPVKHALFAFRRKIGNGVQGIRVPFMIIWLRECLIEGWELNGDVETVKIKYKTIKWCSYDQVSDWNMPTGMSNRDWDTQDQSGGEDIKTYVIMAAIAAATAALGLGLSMGLSPLSSNYTAGDRTKTLKLIE
ncbi:type VI secretion system tube protein Hcp [Rubinisphaera italica]|uniref:Uncharacterized protein n=1 Tax=Rubinisphaera italica TaxID=2527969 RepID=A0A5C5XLY4_9PLAN|nr:type VI secretion system tube protein Hcp [Rubinisphaera italica]TWT64206.1 hypothetical protein Pan54_49670 [Rubinisphaera italica]